MLHKKHPEWTLDIVGDGVEKDRMIKYIEEHNLKDFVTLHGYQTKDYIDNLLGCSSIYLYHNLWELSIYILCW